MEETGTIRLSYRAKLTVVAIGALVIVLFLWQVSEILIPFLWAVVAAYVFGPLIRYVAVRARIPRLLVVLALYLVLGGLVALLVGFVAPLMAQEVRLLRQELPKVAGRVALYLAENEELEVWGLTLNAEVLVNEATRAMQAVVVGLFGRALPVVFGTARLVADLLLFVVATFYLLLWGDQIHAQVLQLVPMRQRAEIAALVGAVNRVLGAYLRGMLFLFALMATVTYSALSLLQVPYALVLGLMTGFLELFPIIGPITAGAIACTVAFFQPSNVLGWPNYAFTGLIALVYFVLRHLEDYLVIPNVIGRVVRLHPLAVLFALFSGGALAGITGLFLAVPVAAMVKVLAKYVYAKVVEEPLPLAELAAPPPGPKRAAGQKAHRRL